ncbi:unnamed protein product [Miscanthus lutarioriparius]|uniref:F-box domain-containing protein n=1 Tax=Miscanthus lutarioriparius TaxID=422564 RepID=A0A811Q5B6_9POAL|nr:unnamed protein product [Miscanthus lutarioriparius]
MGQVQRRCCSGEDRISGLPDELLHVILVRLGSAHAAARSSVLSRHWRHVWAHLPELRLVAPREATPASFINTVDATLGGYLAPTLEHLGVSISTDELDRDLGIPAGRIAPWLHFAVEHVVGELYLYLRLPQWFVQPESVVIREEVVLELPVCERAKQIRFFVAAYALATWLRPQASGLFMALTCLKKGGYVRMEGSDITALVCTQCPCLRDLSLSIELIVNFDVSISSNSLCTMVLHVSETRRLEVVAPKLEEITVIIQPIEAHISAPKLVKVSWHGAYDPHLHRFVDVGRTLQLLRTFYHVATHGRSFLNETNKLPKYSHEQMQLVEFLSCNAGNLKRLLIKDDFCHSPKDLREKFHSICHPNVKVEYYSRKGRQVPLIES